MRIWSFVAGLLVVCAALGLALRRRKSNVPPASLAPPPALAPAPPGPTKPVADDTGPRDWRSLLEANGLGRYASELAKVVRPAVQLTTRKMSGAALAVGQSRVGGAPDLPARFRWPTYKGKHLAFVAQVDLGDVAGVMPDGPLPKQGHLWFFYAWDQEHWGFDPKDAGSSVVHYEADAKLARRALPDDIPDEGRFGATAVTFRAYGDIPDGTDARNPTYHADDATQDRYGDVRNRVASAGGTSHKLLGYAEPIQDEMETECASVTRGIYMGDADGNEDPRAKEADAAKYEWRLLMQVDSDDAASMMWGDAGRLYFWIRDQDLRDRRFEKAWMILQCG